MKINATILLIDSYSTLSMKVDKHVTLEDLARLAGLQGHILFVPKFFILKEERPLEGNEDGFFLGIRLPPKKKGISIPEV
jgi:hypothetical protein